MLYRQSLFARRHADATDAFDCHAMLMLPAYGRHSSLFAFLSFFLSPFPLAAAAIS